MPSLLDVIAQLSTYDVEHVIYAAKPWLSTSHAAVVAIRRGAPASAAAPDDDTADSLVRLVDVADAIDFFSGGWADGLDEESRCERLIQYATFDS